MNKSVIKKRLSQTYSCYNAYISHVTIVYKTKFDVVDLLMYWSGTTLLLAHVSRDVGEAGAPNGVPA